MIHSKCQPLVLLWTLQCMQDADHWCSCKNHNASEHWPLVLLQRSWCIRMLIVGAPAKITMHAGRWVLVLLQRSWCMQGIDAWCSCKNYDACRVLIVGAPAKIIMHARHWSLVLLQRSWCMQDADRWCSCKNHDVIWLSHNCDIVKRLWCCRNTWSQVHLRKSQFFLRQYLAEIIILLPVHLMKGEKVKHQLKQRKGGVTPAVSSGPRVVDG